MRNQAELRAALARYRDQQTVQAADDLALLVGNALVNDPVECDRCSALILPVQPESSDDNLWDALHISIDGSYGEFVDRWDGPLEVTLCHACGHWLMSSDPFWEHLLENDHPMVHEA